MSNSFSFNIQRIGLKGDGTTIKRASAGEASYIFDMYDTNKNGTLEATEQESFLNMVKNLDTDENGRLTDAEILPFMTCYKPVTDPYDIVADTDDRNGFINMINGLCNFNQPVEDPAELGITTDTDAPSPVDSDKQQLYAETGVEKVYTPEDREAIVGELQVLRNSIPEGAYAFNKQTGNRDNIRELLSDENLELADTAVLDALLEALKGEEKDPANNISSFTNSLDELANYKINTDNNKIFEEAKTLMITELEAAIAEAGGPTTEKGKALQAFVDAIENNADLTREDLLDYRSRLENSYGIEFESDTVSSLSEDSEAGQEPETEYESSAPEVFINGTSVSDIVTVLYDSTEGKVGTDEDMVNSILNSDQYTPEELVIIMNAYDEEYGSLLQAIDYDFSGGAETELKNSLLQAVGVAPVSHASIDDETLNAIVGLLHGAMDRPGTDEEIVTGILESYSDNPEIINQIKERYRERYNTELLTAVAGDFSGQEATNLRKILLGIDN